MRPRDIRLIQDIEAGVKAACAPFKGRTMNDDLAEEMAAEISKKIGPAIAAWIGPIFENIKAVNLGKGRMEVTVDVLRDGLERLNQLRRTGDLAPFLEEIERYRARA